MSQVIRWSVLVIGLLTLTNPLEAQKPKPKPGGRSVEATPQEYQQVVAAGEITGKIARIDHNRRIITVALEIPTAQAGGNQNQQAQQNLIRQQQQMARQMMQRPNNNRNPAQQARQIQQQAAQAQRQQMQAFAGKKNGNGGLKTVKKDFEFQADEKAKVRLMSLPQEYDERGKPKQYTAAELKDLKGPNSNLPGYNADFENLTIGQTVKLHLASAKKATAPKPAKPKDADLDKELLPVDPAKPRTTLILILKDEGGLTPAKGEPKKKK